MHDDDRGIFDEDDALDVILYEEITKQEQKRGRGKSGCLGSIVLLLLPLGALFLI